MVTGVIDGTGPASPGTRPDPPDPIPEPPGESGEVGIVVTRLPLSVPLERSWHSTEITNSDAYPRVIDAQLASFVAEFFAPPTPLVTLLDLAFNSSSAREVFHIGKVPDTPGCALAVNEALPDFGFGLGYDWFVV